VTLPSSINRPEPYVREAGAGDAVVCIHANASSSGQWRALMDLLSSTHHVLALDCYGAGKSPDWPSDRFISLADEVAFIEPILARLQSPIALVGHSYGAAVVLKAALTFPGRVRALVLYEPTLFAVLATSLPLPASTDGIRTAVADASSALDAGDRSAAARAFIDYWMGDGSWANMPAHRRQPIEDSMVNVRRWGHALFTEPTPIVAFQQLDVPTLYMVGKRSTASALAVAEKLIRALPRVRAIEFADLGHMGPVTHPEVVNAEIKRFLEKT
jgi:pimeloyl-ACP methyl ester carboxylesterase